MVCRLAFPPSTAIETKAPAYKLPHWYGIWLTLQHGESKE